ncbi:MAG: hypothetical protein NTY14_02110 [Candidatus Omnitrophica bacterium]|nr:hypothetical protein [Candidatus Omnitrophota bacterium]
MKINGGEKEERYEIIIKKFGGEDPIETDIMGDQETQEILHLIGELNLRSAFAS